MPSSLDPQTHQTPDVRATAPNFRMSGLRLDLLALIVLALVSAVRFKMSFDSDKILILPSLAPSVNLACGNGFAHDAFGFDQKFGNKALKLFLDKQAPCFDCSKKSQFVWKATDDWTKIHFNIYYSIGLWWKMTGVCWESIPPYFLTVFLLTSMALYMLFRQAMGSVLSLVMCLPAVTSPANISWLPDIRAYIKYPFFVIFLLFLALMIRYANTRRVLVFAAFSGISAGIGIGFRNDLIQCVAIFFFVVIVMWAFSGKRNALKLSKALAIFLAFFMTSSFMYIKDILSASRSPHAFILGLSEEYFKKTSLSDAPYIIPVLNYDDSVSRLAIAHNNIFQHSATNQNETTLHSYELATSALLKSYVEIFPSDLALRFLSTVVHNLNLPFEQGALAGLSWGGLAWIFPFMLLTASFAIALRDWRMGLALLGTCVAMLGVTSLYREIRHIFYLEFIAYLLTGVTAQAFWIWRKAGYPGISLAALLKAAALPAGAVATALLGIACLRTVQAERVAALIDAYAKAPTSVLAYGLAPAPEGRLRLSLPPLSNPPGFRLLVLTLAPPRLEEQATFKARVNSALPGLSHDLSFALRGSGESALYLPVFADNDALELEKGSGALLRGVMEIPGGVPPWPLLILGPLPDVPPRPPYRTYKGILIGSPRS